MPLTPYQQEVAQALAKNRSPDSHLAGGAALHLEKNSIRYSNDLDYFNDSMERVARAFQEDQKTLLALGHRVQVELTQPGYIRGIVSKDHASTKVDWAQDSAWRFLPPIEDAVCGYRLHPVDLAVNKLLALVGRDEPRDFLDVIDCDQRILSLGALCWAAAGKDPGYTPFNLLELLKRRGKYQAEDFLRLKLVSQVDLVSLKKKWQTLLAQADIFLNQASVKLSPGCLFYNRSNQQFVTPSFPLAEEVQEHRGKMFGVLPRIAEE